MGHISGKYTLQITDPEGKVSHYPIDLETIQIGRAEDCQLILHDEKVSRRHTRIRWKDDGFDITDLGSTNGTQLEKEPLPPRVPAKLTAGQQFTIGNHHLVVLEQVLDAGVETFKIPGHPVLFYRTGRKDWKTLELTEEEYGIGRGDQNEVQILDDQASRNHARLTIKGDELWLTDLGSTNGTRMNGETLKAKELTKIESSKTIRIGNTELIILQPDQSPKDHIPGIDPEILVQQAVSEDIEAAKFSTLDGLAKMEDDTEQVSLNLDDEERTTIGREPDNHICIDHPLVSRYHAVIDRMGTRFRLTDLNSTNGVYVNGEKAGRETWLHDGDTIRVGSYIFTLSGSNLQAETEEGIQLVAENLQQHVTKKINLLQSISLNIRPMEFVALVGTSGSGKTTLLRALSGNWPATHGSVCVNELDLYKSYDLFRDDIGYVPQKDIVHAELTAREALEYAAKLRMPSDTKAPERKARVNEVLDDLDLSHRADVPIAKLSGGQLKRVSIGVELLTKPRLFFLDEPSSGLDPGTEYEMMKLLRRLADKGRTILLVTHATKNVMMCDKVVFLAKGGNLAFFGPPEDSLEYFDQFRTKRERREKPMEFDDIYRILEDESRGDPDTWAARFRSSEHYDNCFVEAAPEEEQKPEEQAESTDRASDKRKVSSLRQFFILASRNLRIIRQDRISFLLTILLAPTLGLLDFIWGRNLFDPVQGDAYQVITYWFMLSIISLLVGSLSSVREIVKENAIYLRERAVILKIGPYIFSKLAVGAVLSLYQSIILVLFRLVLTGPEIPNLVSYLLLFGTAFLGTFTGYLIGLTISTISPNQNASLLLLIAVIVPQLMFGGALLPLDDIPGGRVISAVIPTRWTYESFMVLTGIGDPLVEDQCWSFSKEARTSLDEDEKQHCTCYGENIFENCTGFPGVLSADYYNDITIEALDSDGPVRPIMPTAMPTFTPVPIPAGSVTEDYLEQREEQFDEYIRLEQEQDDQFDVDMMVYAADQEDWARERQNAISSAETYLGNIYDNYGQAFQPSVLLRWAYLLGISAGLTVLILVLQSRKDVV